MRVGQWHQDKTDQQDGTDLRLAVSHRRQTIIIILGYVVLCDTRELTYSSIIP